jgi:chemotaxis protein CheX
MTMHDTPISREHLAELVDMTWSSLLGLAVIPELARARASADSIARVEISGAFNGGVLLLPTERFARLATAVMLGRPEVSLTPSDMHDALGELCNILGGGIKSLLPSPSSLSLPGIVPQTSEARELLALEPIAQYRFLCEGEPLEIRVVELVCGLSPDRRVCQPALLGSHR